MPRKDFLRAMAHDLATIVEFPDDKASLILRSNFMQYFLGCRRGESMSRPSLSGDLHMYQIPAMLFVEKDCF